MKIRATILASAVVMLGLAAAQAQMGRGPGAMGGPARGPVLGGAMAKLFGNNTAFTAAMEMQSENPADGQTRTIPGKMSFDNGKTRFEMDLSNMKGAQMPPEAMAHMKAMGMDKTVAITVPDKKASYIIYPGVQSYVEMPLQDPELTKPESDFKVDVTELGKETMDGHPCVKNKVVVTDSDGAKHESTVWNATDLNKFPVRIETTEQGRTMTMMFKDVKLSKPEASEFEPPSGYKKYDSMMNMMMEQMRGMGPGMRGMGHPGGE